MRSQKRNIQRMCYSAIIAALYVVLTYISMLFGMDKGAIQIRVSEMLCVLPVFFPEAISGLYIGCLLANILTGAMALDIAFGPIATLIGALGAYFLGRWIQKRKTKSIFLKCLIPIPTIVANTVIIPFIIYICYTAPNEKTLAIIPYYALTIFIGEVLSAGVLGTLLYCTVVKNNKYLRR